MKKEGAQAGGAILGIEQKVIPSDLETPVSAFIKLRSRFPGKPAFLFESVERGEQVGRFSILGFAAEEIVRWQAGEKGNPLDLLKSGIAGYQSRVEGLLPFPTGAFGYLSFDAVRAFEKLPAPKGKSPFPDALFVIPERMVLFDHVRNTMTLLAVASKENSGAALGEFEEALCAPAASAPAPSSASSAFSATETRETFAAKVKKIQEHIRSGDIYQAVLSQRLTGETSASAVDIYRALRMLNPSPYMFYLDFGFLRIIGSSPEMMVRVNRETAETRPIAGTRRRGKDASEDSILASELLADSKERAEHTMLVDLGRNDLGRACEYGSVRVARLMEIEKYSHVMHMVSFVEGKLKKGKTSYEVLQAAFPAGTVTGAPKIRAMEIILDLETVPRGPYAGTVGYVGFDGNLDSAITIRTIVMEKNKVFLQAGAGIVADSIPEREYEETLEKLEGMKQALKLAESGFQTDALRGMPW